MGDNDTLSLNEQVEVTDAVTSRLLARVQQSPDADKTLTDAEFHKLIMESNIYDVASPYQICSGVMKGIMRPPPEPLQSTSEAAVRKTCLDILRYDL